MAFFPLHTRALNPLGAGKQAFHEYWPSQVCHQQCKSIRVGTHSGATYTPVNSKMQLDSVLARRLWEKGERWLYILIKFQLATLLSRKEETLVRISGGQFKKTKFSPTGNIVTDGIRAPYHTELMLQNKKPSLPVNWSVKNWISRITKNRARFFSLSKV